MTPTTEFLGWTANIFFIFGAYFLARRNARGFVANAIANIFYAVQGLIMVNPSLMALSVLLTAINLYGRSKWRKLKI